MPESVTDKTPMPITIERRHIDPPGLWIAIVIGSVVLHSLLLWLMFTSKLNLVGRRSNAATPIKIVEVVPTIKAKAKPRVIAQKPKVQPKIQSKPVQVKPEPVPAQPVTNQKPGTIAFTNKIFVKKPVNKSPLVQKKERSLPPIKPKVQQKVAIIPPKPVKTEPKKPNIAEQRRLQRLEEQRRLDKLVQQQRSSELAQQQRLEKLAQQQRTQELAQQRRQDKLAQQQRAEELAQQRRQDKLAQQQRTQELAQQQRLQKLAQQQRAEELAEIRRQDKLAQQQRIEELAQQQRLQKLAQQRQQEIDAQRQKEEVVRNQARLPVGSPVEIDGNAPAPKPTSAPATTTDGTSTQGGFLTVGLLPINNEEQKGLNAGSTTLAVLPRIQETKTSKNLLLNQQDKKLVTEPIKCGVLLSIDVNGNTFSPRSDFPGIKAYTNSKLPGAEDLCQRYADKYFQDTKFIPGKVDGGQSAPSQMRVDITIQPAAPEKKNPS